MSDPRREPPSITALGLYFLRLGALGFGGPVALAASMRRNLVDERRWISAAEYDEGLAIATACPGPLAYQLAVYVGLVLCGVGGALTVAVAFALPPFLLVVAAGAAYVHFGASNVLRALFAGVGPVVVALIVKACVSLARKSVGRDPRAIVVALVAAIVTAALEKEPTVLLVASGLLGVFLFAEGGEGTPRDEDAAAPPKETSLAPAFFAALGASPLAKLFLFFLKTGFLVFGSGLVIVPFLKASVVDRYHWLSERAFLDSVAVGMITPGPVVITATFVGFLLAGVRGAAAATAGIFAPPVLLTIVATPLLRRFRRNRRVRGFVKGLTVAVIGVLAGTVVLVARSAVPDVLAAVIAIVAFGVLLLFPKVPEPLVVLCGAAIGLARGL